MTYIDKLLVVPYVQVSQDGVFLQFSKRDHILDAGHGRRVQRLQHVVDGRGVHFPVVILHLHPVS